MPSNIEIFFLTTLLGVVFLLLLSYKFRLGLYAGLCWGISIGTLSGLIVPLEMSATGLSGRLWSLSLGLVTILGLWSIVILFKFYRDPERIPPEGTKVVVSPADGKVVYVKEIQKGKVPLSQKGEKHYELTELTQTDLIMQPAYLIGIEMSIFDVHVNRTPIQGRIVMQKRVKGEFISLRNLEAPLRNSRLTTVIENGNMRVGVIQIASRLVRSIAAYVNPGDELSLGQRLGKITFGSQVDVVLPEIQGLKILIEAGKKVKAGISIIAQYEED